MARPNVEQVSDDIRELRADTNPQRMSSAYLRLLSASEDIIAGYTLHHGEVHRITNRAVYMAAVLHELAGRIPPGVRRG